MRDIIAETGINKLGFIRQASGRVATAIALVATMAACIDGNEGESPAPESQSGAVSGRCDEGFNIPEFNESTDVHAQHNPHEHHGSMSEDDYTVSEWAEVFVDPELGATAEEVVDDLEQAQDTSFMGIYRRYIENRVLAHRLGPAPWIPMTNPEECAELREGLSQAQEAVARTPTVGDALAAGYRRADNYYAGFGVHLQNDTLMLEPFDPARPAQFLAAGTEENSPIIAVSYVVHAPEGQPEGFPGDNDHPHEHEDWCFDENNLNQAADVVDRTECEEVMGGSFLPNPDLFMTHAWVVRGWENRWGTFSEANPDVPYLPEDQSLPAGYNADSNNNPLDIG